MSSKPSGQNNASVALRHSIRPYREYLKPLVGMSPPKYRKEREKS